MGKTITSVNLCEALNLMGKTVLPVDCESQGNASSDMSVFKSAFFIGLATKKC